MKRINVHLKEEQIKELQRIADKKEAPLAYIVRLAIKMYLDAHK